MVKGDEVYIRGGKIPQKDQFYRIHFFLDGSIREFTADEAFIIKQGGITLSVVAGRKVSLWKNGNIRLCSASNENSFMVENKEYKLKGKWKFENRDVLDYYDVYRFDEDGSVDGFDAKLSIMYATQRSYGMEAIVDMFHPNGNIWRTTYIVEEYSNKIVTSEYVEFFFNQQGDMFYDISNYICRFDDSLYPRYVFALQDGDLGANVATVQFDADGVPESYTLFKLDDDGDYLLDDYGVPVEDTATVKPFKK